MESGLRQLFERHRVPVGCHLLGDSGYPCKTWVWTPYLNPQPGAQLKYNISTILLALTADFCKYFASNDTFGLVGVGNPSHNTRRKRHDKNPTRPDPDQYLSLGQFKICRLHIHDANLPFHHIPKVLYWIEIW
ncbi:hypothetical protein N1851_017547 [Merluccius polli]|uniref:DDE Tnp4 domain-containing protein n=1 Tax=Merluccius polli TaxID=89951 RepID=A0AA47NYY9_MERPO|nr:hypothetical protein N1851_017547 [Merluccius polli]